MASTLRPATIWRRFLVISALPVVLALPPAPAGAEPILSVIGAGGNVAGSILSLRGDALAASFDLANPYTNVSLEVSLTCLQCRAEFFLVQNAIGPAANFVENVRAVTTVDTLLGGGFINTPTPLFSGLSLTDGTYFLVMSLTANTVSGAVWTATQMPAITAAAGASNLPHLRAFPSGFDASTPPRSVFVPHLVNGIDTVLQYSLAGDPVPNNDPAPIPEPASGILVLAGLMLWRRYHS